MHLFSLCWFPLIFTNININLCEKVPFRVFYFWYLFSIDIDIIENHGHPLYILVYRNQQFIFLHWKNFVFTDETLIRRKTVGVQIWNLRMGKSKKVTGKWHHLGKVLIQQVARILVWFSLIKLIDTGLKFPLSRENLLICEHAHLQVSRMVS